MPIYDYQCTACSHRTEVVHGLNESGPATCGACGGGPMRKLFAPPSIVFKGTGWAKKERGSSGGTKASKSKPADSSTGSSGTGSSDAGSSGSTSSSTSTPSGD